MFFCPCALPWHKPLEVVSAAFENSEIPPHVPTVWCRFKATQNPVCQAMNSVTQVTRWRAQKSA